MTAGSTLSVLALTLVIAAGCGRANDGDAAPPAPALEAPAAEVPFHIVATDAGFEAASRIPAGLRHIVFENRGSEIHEAMLVKLPAGMSPADYVAAVKGGSLFPEGALDYSGPGLTEPGESLEVWARVDPGQYILMCWNHSTTTPPHSFAVDAEAKDDAIPEHDLLVRLFDYRFEIQGELGSGARVIRFETPGPSMHEVDVFRLHEGRDVSDVVRWRKSEDESVPHPALAMGGVLDSHDISRIVWLRRTFAPGRYVLHCGMPMPGTAGAERVARAFHSEVGMARELVVRNGVDAAD